MARLMDRIDQLAERVDIGGIAVGIILVAFAVILIVATL